jgi:hypothetical protein
MNLISRKESTNRAIIWKNPQRIQTFILRSNGFVETMLENGIIAVEQEDEESDCLQIILN